jgi:hypothetical protein
MRALVALAFVAGCTGSLRPIPAGVHVWESDANLSEGETTIETDPDTAYAIAIDYARWATMFSDITKVDVTSQDGDDAHVTLFHGDGNCDNLHFHNEPGAHRVWFEDTGGVATLWAEIVFAPGRTPNTTLVHSRLYAKVHGVTSIFVSKDRLRVMREQRIVDDLVHLRGYFAHPHVARLH